MDTLILETKKLTKVYPNGVVALDDVDFELKTGEVHAVLGENGAGKTTLMMLLAGILQPTRGKILINGREIAFKTPLDALSIGIGMVQQHLTLIERMSIFENFVLKYGKKDFLINREYYENLLEKGLNYFGIEIPIDYPVDFLSASQKQLLEILFLFLRNVKVLILDEPTSTLGGIESERLLSLINKFKKEGKSIVFVTHKIHEALRVADRITVLRRGKLILTEAKKNVNEEMLVKSIMGAYGRETVAELTDISLTKAERKKVLEVKNLNLLDDRDRHKVKDVSFEIYQGEIFGIGGMQGSGQKELIEAITGLRRIKSGRVMINQKEITDAYTFLLLGGCYIPAERLGMGVCPDLDIMINSNLRNIAMNKRIVTKLGIIDQRSMKEYTKRVLKFLDVVYPELGAKVHALSGGNVQKLIVSREAIETSTLLVAEEPTAGLDIFTAKRTLEVLRHLKTKGVSILIVSTELDDLLNLCDRVGILYEGKLVKVFRPGELSLSEIGRLILGGSL